MQHFDLNDQKLWIKFYPLLKAIGFLANNQFEREFQITLSTVQDEKYNAFYAH